MLHSCSVCGTQVWLASEQKEIEVKSLFSEKDRMVMVFARSFG